MVPCLKGTLLSPGQLNVCQDPQILGRTALLSHSLSWVICLQDLTFPFVELQEVSVGPFLQLSECPSEWQHNHLVYQLLLLFLYHAILLRVHPVLSSTSLMKILNNIALRIDP